MRTFRRSNLILFASALPLFVCCTEKPQIASSIVEPTVSQKEVGLTTEDGEEQLWENIPGDMTWELSQQKTIDGQNLEEWIKSHPLNYNYSGDTPKVKLQKNIE